MIAIPGCALAKTSGPWRPTFALGRLENLRFFIQIICCTAQILQVQSTGLPSIFLKAQPCHPYYIQHVRKENNVKVILIIMGHLHGISLEPDSRSLPKTLRLYPSLCLLLFIQNISPILIGSKSRANSFDQVGNTFVL